MKIAITGGIGSGKSAVARHVKNLGYPTYSCDKIYKDLLKDADFVKKVSTAMNIPPKTSINGDICLDTESISNKVFSSKDAKKILEGVTHPAILKEVERLTEGHEVSFTEVPLLFENGLEKNFDAVIVVMRPLEKRISAIAKRDGLCKEKILSRIKNQYDYENSDFSGHTVIYNDTSLEGLKKKAEEAIEKILKK